MIKALIRLVISLYLRVRAPISGIPDSILARKLMRIEDW
jgi:hypothetical protein